MPMSEIDELLDFGYEGFAGLRTGQAEVNTLAAFEEKDGGE